MGILRNVCRVHTVDRTRNTEMHEGFDVLKSLVQSVEEVC